MRVFVTKEFGRFARAQKIGDEMLSEAVQRAEDGLVDADLGGAVIKQRVARPGQGRRSGFRTLIAYRPGQRAVFVHGFAKNERDDIDKDDLKRLRRFAAEILSWGEQRIRILLENGKWREVFHNAEE